MKEKHTLILIFISVISYTKYSMLFGVKLVFFIYRSYMHLIVVVFDLRQGKCINICFKIQFKYIQITIQQSVNYHIL